METLTSIISITESLGIRGWSHLDAVILASLATESPLLLIGPHGTAKSLLVEKVANALKLPMRHYNAALLNYDDLVGIPMPDETGKNLNFISTPGTIWDAGFVFFDEISRCRIDLQNKLFPIIHERRVVGIDLEDLKHRWSAMNPPAPEDTDIAGNGNYYIGSEPLDPALTDRFPFIVPVPNWEQLTKEDQRQLVDWKSNGNSSQPTQNLVNLVVECKKHIEQIEEEFSEWMADYIIYVINLLEQANLPQSPRRAVVLARSIVAIHAARMVLEQGMVSPEESAETAILYGLPQSATEVPPSQVKIMAIHKQAWEIAEHLEDDIWRQVMEEFDPARRVALADELGFEDHDLSRLITQAIGSEDSDARQIGLATAIFMAFNKRRNLDPSAYEPLAQLAYHVLEPRTFSLSLDRNGPQTTTWNEIKNWIENQNGREETLMFHLQRNYLLYGLTKLWGKYSWAESLQQFNKDLLLFGLEEDTK